MRPIPEDREEDQAVEQEETSDKHSSEAGVRVAEWIGRPGLCPSGSDPEWGGTAEQGCAPLGAGEHRERQGLAELSHGEAATLRSRVMVHKFGGSATIHGIHNPLRHYPTMKLLHAPAAAVLCLGCLLPLPAQASVSTAAWVTAASICRAFEAGLTIQQAVRVGMNDNRYLWAAEMQDPAFVQLMTAEAIRQCPEQLIRAYQSGGKQL